MSKYFDTLNHEKLLNLLRKEIKDERVIQLVKRFLKSGGMEKGVVIAKAKRCLQDWLNYYVITSMKNTLAEWNDWLHRRIRMYIWKQWKKPSTKYHNLLNSAPRRKMPEWQR